MRPMSSSASPRGIAAIVGVGPRLGRSVARKFAHEGYSVAILARDLGKRAFLLSSTRPCASPSSSSLSAGKLSWLADEIAREAKAQVFAIRIDCADPKSVREAFEGVLSLGSVEVLAYTACEAPHATCQPTRFTDVAVESFVRSLAESAVGAFHCAQQVIPGMLERGRGTIIFTGSSASIRGFAGYCELSCGKFALRGLAQCLAREFQSSGIHIAHVIIDGVVGAPRIHGSSKGGQETASLDPDAVAQTYWHIHVQEKGAWAQEMDLRA
ncbi:unnamed protein product [Musa acuminata subsp. malaccensis]|uniref:(wild Malaysian banana) hypothetical protein n=1 Tax=Musa acuminata subsp. malaccensis TaxID=214687 RepID=A0A8D7FCX0_MUSAM|nr:unnamed protein product [Musa acuminata subsp. malaccensis]